MRRLSGFALPGLLVLSVIIGGCGSSSDSGGGEAPAMNYSGTYQVTSTEGEEYENTSVITQEGSNVTCLCTEHDGGTVDFQGTVSGNIMTMTQTNCPPGHPMTMVISFSDDGQSFSGTWTEVDKSFPITGTKIS